jgi:hypothetical protein
VTEPWQVDRAKEEEEAGILIVWLGMEHGAGVAEVISPLISEEERSLELSLAGPVWVHFPFLESCGGIVREEGEGGVRRRVPR